MKKYGILAKLASALCLCGALLTTVGCSNDFTYPPVYFPEAPQNMGEGTKASPYTVAGALFVINSYTIPDHKVYVEGIVSEITELDPSYGNATYILSDQEDPESTIIIYRGYGLGGDKFTSTDDLSVGDVVVAYGTLVNFKDNTPEMEQGNWLYKINDTVVEGDDPNEQEGFDEPAGDGTFDSPYNVAKAREIIAANEMTSDKVYVKGVVSKVTSIETSYGNATYYIKDAGWSETLYIYRGYYLDGKKFTSTDQLKAGDEVIVCGELMNYNNKSPQMAQGNFLAWLNGTAGSGSGSGSGSATTATPAGDGTAASPYNVARTLEIIGNGQMTDDNVYVKGVVAEIQEISTSYGNATYTIQDAGYTATFLIYRGYGVDGKKFTSADDLKAGQEVVVCGKLINFNGTYEMAQGSKIIGDPSTVVEETKAAPAGDGTEASPYNVARTLEIIGANQMTDAEVYVTGEISEIKELDTGTYGNASYYIKDAGYTATFLIYRGYYLNGDKFTSADQLKVGQKVVVTGKLINYNGTYEMEKGNKLVSVE